MIKEIKDFPTIIYADLKGHSEDAYNIIRITKASGEMADGNTPFSFTYDEKIVIRPKSYPGDRRLLIINRETAGPKEILEVYGPAVLSSYSKIENMKGKTKKNIFDRIFAT